VEKESDEIEKAKRYRPEVRRLQQHFIEPMGN
jgi:hypothetical protein